MPDFRRANCRVEKGGCGKNATEVGPLSWTGLCGACGEKKHVSQLDALHYRRGPEFDHWARRSFMAARKQLLDLESQTP